jgi:hypothetical protein
MKMKHIALPFAAIAFVAAASIAVAQIERLDLAQMVSKSDNAVFGTITNKEVFRIDHPRDGVELYFTSLTIQGRSLRTGDPLTVDVAFAGGFVDDRHGVYNSKAPSADDTRIGNKVVVFYKWTDNMGGDLAANSIYAAHGGIYRTFETPKGATVVQGRGEGYAVAANVELTALGQQVATLAKAPKQK